MLSHWESLFYEYVQDNNLALYDEDDDNVDNQEDQYSKICDCARAIVKTAMHRRHQQLNEVTTLKELKKLYEPLLDLQIEWTMQKSKVSSVKAIRMRVLGFVMDFLSDQFDM